MASYTPTTNFGAKDSLPSNDPNKVVKGAEFTDEFEAISTALAGTAPTLDPVFTGTVTFASAAGATLDLTGALTAASLATTGNVDVTGDLTVSGALNTSLGVLASEQYVINTVNAAVLAPISELDDIADVDVSSAVADQILTYNGTDWVAVDAPSPLYDNYKNLTPVSDNVPLQSRHLQAQVDATNVSSSTYAALIDPNQEKLWVLYDDAGTTTFQQYLYGVTGDISTVYTTGLVKETTFESQFPSASTSYCYFYFNNDGSKLIGVGSSNEKILHQWTLPTLFSPVGAVHEGFVDLSAQLQRATALRFFDNGNKFVTSGGNYHTIHNTATPYSVLGATYSGTQVNATGTPIWSDDGLSGLWYNNAEISEFTLTAPFDVTQLPPTFVNTVPATNIGVVPAPTTLDGGMRLLIKDTSARPYTIDCFRVRDTVTVDCADSTVYTFDINSDTAVAFTNAPAAGTAYGVTLEVTQKGSHSIEWSDAVRWPSDTAPTLSLAVDESDVFTMYTHDGGVTFNAFVSGQAFV